MTTANPQFHAFVDASLKAYAAAVYLNRNSEGINLPPYRQKQAALCELDFYFKIEFIAPLIGISRPSLLLHSWMNSEHRSISGRILAASFIESQIGYKSSLENGILEATSVKIGCVNTSDNTSDVATREIQSAEFLGMNTWWHGPS